MVQEHQREQPAHLRLVRGERELAREPDRLGGQVHPAPVPGRVDEVEHAQHDGEVTWLVEPASPQRALGPADPLRHRRLRDVEGVGDLAGREAADGAQGQRHLGGGRELGVTTAEEQEEGVVALAALVAGNGRRLGARRLLAAVTGALAAACVDEPARRDHREPRARIARRVLGPHPQRVQQRLLQRILGCIEVLAATDEAREHPGHERAQHPLVQRSARAIEHGGQSSECAPDMTSRTSIHSYRGVPPGPGSEET